MLTRAGLKMSYSSGLSRDRADQLAALAAGIQSLSLSASAEFGDALGAGQAMVKFAGGLLLIVPAGEDAHLAVVAEEDGEVGLIAHNMNELVEQIGRLPHRRAQIGRERRGMNRRPIDWESPDRLYTVTGGRTHDDETSFDAVSLTVSECDPVPGMQSEHVKILQLARRPTAVVEISAELRLPVSVVKILLRDLLDTDRITVRHPSALAEAGKPAPEILRQVLVALNDL